MINTLIRQVRAASVVWTLVRTAKALDKAGHHYAAQFVADMKTDELVDELGREIDKRREP